MVAAIQRELVLRKAELHDEVISTIYFGGGTPSLLSGKEIDALLLTITNNFEVDTHPEITLEGNPDDLNASTLMDFKQAGINRLSIGIQSFDDSRLLFINRTHSGHEAKKSLEKALEIGFDNISADLMYALPPEDIQYWERDLEQMLSYHLPHLSLYGLTIEDKTVFGKWAKKGIIQETSEELASSQYMMAIDQLSQSGYDHYEVSNFAKPGMHSRHNSAYWDAEKYLGVGPGAHSYDGKDRGYNISHNAKYLSSLSKGKLPITWEKLSERDQLNEYIFTHLRTKKGISLQHITTSFHKDLLSDYPFIMNEYLTQKLAIKQNDRFYLTSKGFMLADEISWRLFYDE